MESSGSKAQHELERIEQQIQKLETVAGDNQLAHDQLHALLERVANLRKQVSATLGPWEKVELARHPQRPYTLDYVANIFTDFSATPGDRGPAEDRAII